jgi:hypothetical protein
MPRNLLQWRNDIKQIRYAILHVDTYIERAVGVWKFNREKWQKGVENLFHGSLSPDRGHLESWNTFE